MKILQDIQEFINISIVDKNIELEYIYGYRNNRSINKETFIKLLDYLKKEYKFVDEDNTLDIRREIDYKGRKSISSIRKQQNTLDSYKWRSSGLRLPWGFLIKRFVFPQASANLPCYDPRAVALLPALCRLCRRWRSAESSLFERLRLCALHLWSAMY